MQVRIVVSSFIAEVYINREQITIALLLSCMYTYILFEAEMSSKLSVKIQIET